MSQEAQQSPDQQAQNAQYCLRALHDLIDIGTDLARLIHHQALRQAEAATHPATDPRPELSAPSELSTLNESARHDAPVLVAQVLAAAFDPTVAFDRISRAIRRTIILAQKLNEPPPARIAPEQRTAARKRIIRAVEDKLHRIVKGEEAERLHAEFLDLVDEPELDDDIAARPVDAIIKEICNDLGIGIARVMGDPPSKRRTPADIALLAARAAAKPSPKPQSSTPAAFCPAAIIALRPDQPVPIRSRQPTAAGKRTDPPRYPSRPTNTPVRSSSPGSTSVCSPPALRA